MPLIHPDYRDYPEGWLAFSMELRAGRALHRCECSGQCQHHHGQRCIEVNKQPGIWMQGRVVLSCAHICDCYPLCKIKEHIVVMCQKCHLRTDRFRHAAARLRTQANAGMSSCRPKRTAQEIHFEDLQEILRTPKRKRTRFWYPR